MNENLKKLEEERKKIRKLQLIMYGISLFLVGIAIVLCIVLDFIVFLFIAIVIAAILIGVVVSKTKSFNAILKQKVVVGMVHELLGEDAVYEPNGGINLDLILKLGIYKSPDRYHEEDYISAVYNGVPYEMCDVRLQEEHARYDSKGHRTVTYATYFSGRIIRIDFKRNMNTFLMVIEGNPNGLRTGKLEKVETEVIDFNKKHKIYVNSKEQAFYFLTPVLIQKMLELEKLFKGSIQYCIDGDCFYILMNNSIDSLDASVSKKIDEKMIAVLRSQITIGEAIINEFGLDEMKFNEDIEV